MVIRVAILILAFLAMHGCSTSSPASSMPVTIAGKTFELELVFDTNTRTTGLMNKTSIPDNGGMLFVFPDATIRSFWMKNCFVAIDLLFLDSRGTITALHEMPIEPAQGVDESDWSYDGRLAHYWSNSPSRYAIELSAGSIKQLKLRINDRVELDLPYLNSIAR